MVPSDACFSFGEDFNLSSVVKTPATGDTGFNLGWKAGRKWQLTQYSHFWRIPWTEELAGFTSMGHTEWTSVIFLPHIGADL